MARKKISTIEESSTGRNKKFRDNYTGDIMSRSELVRKIEGGQYPDHHVRVINGVKTPVSSPDKSKNNNLD